MTSRTNITINQQEGQLILQHLAWVADAEQYNRKYLKMAADMLWKNSDKDSPAGAEWFKQLNKVKDDIRSSKAREKKINAMIRKIKKGM